MSSITVDELRAIPAPEPTKSWRPVSHIEVYDQVGRVIREKGFEVLSSRIDAHRGGSAVFVSHRMKAGKDGYFELGWRNSTNKTMSLGFTSGQTIIVCSNMVFSGKWMQFRKHTSGLSSEVIFEMASQGFDYAVENSTELDQQQDRMKEIALDRKQVDLLFMQFFRQGVVSGSRLGELVNAWDEEYERSGESLHTAFQCATQTFRNLSLPAIDRKSAALNRVVQHMIAEA